MQLSARGHSQAGEASLDGCEAVEEWEQRRGQRRIKLRSCVARRTTGHLRSGLASRGSPRLGAVSDGLDGRQASITPSLQYSATHLNSLRSP